MRLTDQLADTWWHMQLRRFVARLGRWFLLGVLLVTVAWLADRLVRHSWRALVWHWRCTRVAPWWLVALPLATGAVYWWSWPLGVAALTAWAVSLAVGRWARPDLWAEKVTQPSRIGRLRRDWPRVAAACQLGHAGRLTGDRYPFGRAARSPHHQYPRLTAATWANSGRTLRLTLECPPGQIVRDITQQAPRLAATLHARAVTVTEQRPGVAIVTATMTTQPAAITQGDSLYPAALNIGATETGEPWLLPTGVHMLCAGVTGAGKGSVMWSGIAELAPAIEAGIVRLAGVDLKGGMELTWGRDLFTEFATDPTDAVDLLGRMATAMDQRAKRMAGQSRTHVPTEDDPAWLIVIDELATLTAYIADRQLRQAAIRSLNLLLTKGRAPGFSVWAFLQDPAKDVLDNRQLFPLRVGMRLAERVQTAMLFGENSGVLCEQISRTEPGTAYVRDEQGDIIKTRARWTSDKRIRQIAKRHAAPPMPDTDPQIVYFVRNADTGQIKIGISNDVTRRLRTLQTGSAAALDLLGTMPGGRAKEAELHARFADSRTGGEWFDPTPELDRFIEEHAA